MRLLKKFVRKLYHLIWFLSLFLLFVSPAKAEVISNMTYSTFRTYASSYTILSNQYIFTTRDLIPINMNAVAGGAPFEWITSYTMGCTGTTIVSGKMRFDGNANLTYDWLSENIKDIYYNPNYSGAVSTFCSWSVNPSNLILSYSCPTNEPHNNYIIGGHFVQKTGTFNAQFLIWREVNITCDKSATAIIENNNTNTDRIINDNRREQAETRESIDAIDDTLNDSSIDSPNNSIDSLKNQLPTNSVISDLLLLPVTLLQSIVNSIGGSCSSFSLGSLYGTNLSMPCIDIPSYVGSTIWAFIDLVFSGMFILAIRKKFIQIWENITNLKGGSNEVD